MTSDREATTAADEEAVPGTFLHQGSKPSERVEPPRLITPSSFRLLWVGLLVVIGVLLAIGAVVAGRVT